MAHIHFAAVEMDGSNQAIFIATDIENRQIAYLIGRGEDCPEFVETAKFSVVDNFVPSGKRALAVWVFFPKLAQSFPGDNVHDNIISHIEILIKVNGCIAKVSENRPERV